MNKRLVIPCMRGYMGSWITYSCMMRLSDVGELVGFAHELHQIEKLSEKIQRELNMGRAEEISKYLIENDDRFFNSLVVAIYDGDPNWHDIGNLTPNNEEANQLDVPEYASECLGFLSITKKERLFALDGQHRLAGIKHAMQKKTAIGDDLINVIIVAHSNTPLGRIKSRRLFTTLNKKAKLVSKDAIIALDEDDIAACITRLLIESDDFVYFNEHNVSASSGPIRDQKSITSIVNIYDNVQKLVAFKLKTSISDLEKYRYRDHESLYDFVTFYFSEIFRACNVLLDVCQGKLLPGTNRAGDDGGHLLLRPIGWDIFTNAILTGLKEEKFDLTQLIGHAISQDLTLAGDVLCNKVWSRKQKKILKVGSGSQRAITKSLLP